MWVREERERERKRGGESDREREREIVRRVRERARREREGWRARASKRERERKRKRMCLSNACCDGIRGLRALLSLHITFTFMHLADTFTQSDLQSIQAIHFFHQYVMHLWGICIIIHASQSRGWAEGQVSHPCVRHFKLSQDVLRHVVFSHRIHHEILISGWTLRWPVLMALFLMDRHNTISHVTA